MSEPSASDTPEAKRPRPRAFSLFRSFVLADFITLGNAASGTVSIFLCLNYLDNAYYKPYILGAFVLLPLALVLDFFDGWIARKRQRSSPFGADLDSLADIISFGVAPAVLGFTLGLRGIWDMALLVYFVCCGISRLARFNVTAEALSEGTGKVKYYEGTPIPTSLGIVILLGIAWSTGHVGEALWFGKIKLGIGHLHPMSLVYGLSGSLMVSQALRIPKP